MILKAHMLAYRDGAIREIDIPEEEVPPHWDWDKGHRLGLLGSAFTYGQNDFQPRPMPSLSVGDVVELPDGTLHLVLGVGWKHFPADTDINTLPRGRDAVFGAYRFELEESDA